MRLTFRAKQLIIVGATALALLLLILTGVLAERTVGEQLGAIEARYLPLLELGPQLDGDLERVRRAFQDAVAAQDADALNEARRLRDAFIGRLDAARGEIATGDATELRAAFDAYYDASLRLSRK